MSDAYDPVGSADRRKKTMKKNVKKGELKPLEPVDIERCQTDVPNGATFMTLGGRPGLVRCSNKPSIVATEVKADEHGRKGSMSLCGDCFNVFQKQIPAGFATFMTMDVWVKEKKDG